MVKTEEQKQKSRDASCKWRLANLEKSRAACKKWRANHPGAQAAATKAWSIANPGKAKAATAAYRAANPTKTSEWAKNWRKRNRGYHLVKHGLALEEFDAMFASQGGSCAICRAVKKLCVDHDHTTGKIRGLLCSHCNSALGMAKDSFQTLIRAADYIRRRSLVQIG